MENANKEEKFIKYLFRGLAILVLIVGTLFSYLIAELNDAPGMMIIGPTMILVVSALVYGFGEFLLLFKKSSALLSSIEKKLSKKEK